MPDNFGRMTSSEAPKKLQDFCYPKRKPKRMTYDDVFSLITKYAPEMQSSFADKFSRFPEGGNAAMIVNFLNDRAASYRTIDVNIANDLVDAAGEIIVRCG